MEHSLHGERRAASMDVVSRRHQQHCDCIQWQTGTDPSEQSFPVFVLNPQAFELATGDYLFEPHSGEDYSRDEGSAFDVLCTSNCTTLR